MELVGACCDACVRDLVAGSFACCQLANAQHQVQDDSAKVRDCKHERARISCNMLLYFCTCIGTVLTLTRRSNPSFLIPLTLLPVVPITFIELFRMVLKNDSHVFLCARDHADTMSFTLCSFSASLSLSLDPLPLLPCSDSINTVLVPVSRNRLIYLGHTYKGFKHNKNRRGAHICVVARW